MQVCLYIFSYHRIGDEGILSNGVKGIASFIVYCNFLREKKNSVILLLKGSTYIEEKVIQSVKWYIYEYKIFERKSLLGTINL